MPNRRADNYLPAGHARRHGGTVAGNPRRAYRSYAGPLLSRVSAAGLLLVAGAVSGCGSTAPIASSASAQPLEITSPALTKSGSLGARYTCAGGDVSPPVRWGNVPSGTAELALFLLNLSKPKVLAGGTIKAKVVVAWSVHGLRPALGGLAPGRLPAGATIGPKRYTICPPKGGTGEYLFRLYALPRRLATSPHLSDVALFKQVNKASTAVGYFISIYHRP